MGGIISKVAFVPPPATYSTKADLHYVKTKENDTIPYVYHNGGSNMTIIFGHANAEDIGMVNTWMYYLMQTLEINTVAYDYPGYGVSTGKPSEKGVLAAAEACIEDVRRKHRVPYERMIVWGRSIGCGPSTHLAARYPVRGLILQSAPASILSVPFGVKAFGGAAPFDMFNNMERIQEVLCPVFVVHGTADEMCPVDHGLMLFSKCRNPWQAWTIPTATHDNIELDHLKELLEYVRTFVDFCDESFCPPSGKYTAALDEFVQAESRTANLGKRGSSRGCM